MKFNKNDVLFTTAILLAIWFAWAGMVWVYWAALYIAYPFGFISFMLWVWLKRGYRKRNIWIPRILIIGLMFGSLTASVISVLAYFSSASQLQQYMFWSFGSLGNLSWNEITALLIVFLIGISFVVIIIKPLNSLLLGENYAKSMGVNVKRTRNLTLIATSLLTGVITAFSGPIAFIGLAVPHITKLLFSTSNHKTLIPAVAISGAIIMLICDSIAQLATSEYTLPINAITSLFGAPIIIWLLVRKRKVYY